MLPMSRRVSGAVPKPTRTAGCTRHWPRCVMKPSRHPAASDRASCLPSGLLRSPTSRPRVTTAFRSRRRQPSLQPPPEPRCSCVSIVTVPHNRFQERCGRFTLRVRGTYTPRPSPQQAPEGCSSNWQSAGLQNRMLWVRVPPPLRSFDGTTEEYVVEP